jgi:hypothetical protein
MSQRGIESADGVALAKDETVSIGVLGFLWVKGKNPPIGRHQNIHDRKGSPQMSRFRPVGHVDDTAPDGPGHGLHFIPLDACRGNHQPPNFAFCMVLML